MSRFLVLVLLFLVSCSGIPERDIPVYQREAAIIKFAEGDPGTANDLLYDSFEKLDPKEDWGSFLMGQLKAGLTDARAMKYRPDDYELILMLTMRTITDICLGGRDRADLYLAQERQNSIFRSYANYDLPSENKVTRDNYQLLALPYYLVAARQESSPTTVDRAKQAYSDMLKILHRQGTSSCPLAEDMLKRIEKGNLYPNGGAVHVIGFLGRGPKKIEKRTMLVPLMMTAVKIIITRWGLGKRIAGSDISIIPFKYPELIRRRRLINGFSVASENGLTQSSIITDISAVAHSQFEARKPWILAQALLCRIFKEAIVRTTEGISSRKMKNKNAKAFLKIGALIGLAFWEASERADTRCWTLLPDTIQAARIDLPEGTHSIKIRAHSSMENNSTMVQVNNIHVAKGRNSFVFVFFPSPGAKPAVISSGNPL